MKARFKVRFHLGLGDNYRKWQITDRHTGKLTYIDPSCSSFEMIDCRLVNRKSVAVKINSGHNKSVCAWIDCNHINNIQDDCSNCKCLDSKISFNPRQYVHWFDSNGNDIDNNSFNCLLAVGREVYKK